MGSKNYTYVLLVLYDTGQAFDGKLLCKNNDMKRVEWKLNFMKWVTFEQNRQSREEEVQVKKNISEKPIFLLIYLQNNRKYVNLCSIVAHDNNRTFLLQRLLHENSQNT